MVDEAEEERRDLMPPTCKNAGCKKPEGAGYSPCCSKECLVQHIGRETRDKCRDKCYENRGWFIEQGQDLQAVGAHECAISIGVLPIA